MTKSIGIEDESSEESLTSYDGSNEDELEYSKSFIERSRVTQETIVLSLSNLRLEIYREKETRKKSTKK